MGNYSLNEKTLNNIVKNLTDDDVDEFVKIYKDEIKTLISIKVMAYNNENIDDWECVLDDKLFDNKGRYLDIK